MKYRLAEIFGPTIQGEGPQVGLLCSFIRLGGCDYRCSWCDSLHAVLPESVTQLPLLTQYEILTMFREHYEASQLQTPQWVIISGGNPALFDLKPLIDLLHSESLKVSIETQGSKTHESILLADFVVISPKPPSSGMTTDLPALTELVLRLYEDRRALKVVVFTNEDLEYARFIHRQFPQVPLYLSVGTFSPNTPYTEMHRVEEAQELILSRYRILIAEVFQLSDLRDTFLLPQLHVITWGHMRGV